MQVQFIHSSEFGKGANALIPGLVLSFRLLGLVRAVLPSPLLLCHESLFGLIETDFLFLFEEQSYFWGTIWIWYTRVETWCRREKKDSCSLRRLSGLCSYGSGCVVSVGATFIVATTPFGDSWRWMRTALDALLNKVLSSRCRNMLENGHVIHHSILCPN